jgi:ABC-type polysaccharide/polyol phosphate transport system ATPase subunit
VTPAIEVHGLKKEFLLNTSGASSFKTMFLWRKAATHTHLEVLRGLDFTIPKGECAAVIGRNGAGKSTLLSLLARVYKPTKGEIKIHGRMAPLLELGAGFHPDLTGRENVFFNGIILGLTRAEMRARLDQIVEFAELQRHIDAPVRTYSSGMMARLGFSVAVHVDAEVLLVDEVLAVGDFEFERKCYAKIDEFRSAGGTILFVSHQMDAVRRVADRCLWLHKGMIRDDGPPEAIIREYELADAAPGVEPS